MANAYDVMSMAKRQGAEVKAVEEYDKYIKQVRDEEARASKAMNKGKLGGAFGGSIASFLAPAAIGALGIGTGGLGTMALSALVGGGLSRGGTEIGDFLARQWSMGGKGREKGFKDIGKMKGVSGPYGQRRASELRRAGRNEMEGYQQTISELLDIENTNRWISSAMSGLTTAGKVRGGLEGLGKDASMGERMKAAMRGDVGAGYKLGAKDTGDFWQQKGIDRSLAKNVMTPNQLSPFAQQMSQDPSKAMSSYYQDTMGDIPLRETDYFSGISKAEATPTMTFAPPKPSVPLALEESYNMPWEMGRDADAFSEFGKYGTMEEALLQDSLFGEWGSAPARSSISTGQIGTPRKSLTILQQLLQGGR